MTSAQPPVGSVPLVTSTDLTSSYGFLLNTLNAIASGSNPGHLANFDSEAGMDYLEPAGAKLVEALILYADQVFEALWVRHHDTGDINEGVFRECRRLLTVRLLLERIRDLPRPPEGKGRPGLQDYEGAIVDLLEPVTRTRVEW